MQRKRLTAMLSSVIITTGVLAGCGSGGTNTAPQALDANAVFPLSIGFQQVGDIPDVDNDVQKAIEKYTNTKLSIQWIPDSNYDEKINVMIASNELPQMIKVKQTPSITSALQSGQFWEIGPYLKDYKNLSALNKIYYDNIAISGKVYGIPNFRDIGRAGIIYRKDWLDAMGMKLPTTTDEWYNVLKAMTLNDPDKNGKNDTYGTVLYKTFNGGTASMLMRMAVSLGAPNMWGVDSNGKMTPAFTTAPYRDVLKLFRRLYAEKLINQDFAVFTEADAQKLYDSGRVGFRVTVASNAKNMQDRLIKTVPTGNYDVEPLKGPQGIRLPGETGNVGFYIMSKKSVKTEAELKRILAFADKMMDEPMNTLQLRGIEGRHYKKTADNKQEIIDQSLLAREIKPYRDNLFNFEGVNILPLKDVPIGEKTNALIKENAKYVVANPALTLDSATYSDRGKQLETIIADAETNYVMGKIDDAGWQAEIEKWKKAGGDLLIKEYEADYAKSHKK